MTIKTIKVRGEDIRPGQYVVFDNKAFYVLQNNRGRPGGSGAFKLKCNWRNPWRDYEYNTTYQIVTKS